MRFLNKTGLIILSASLLALGGCTTSQEDRAEAVANQGIQPLYADARNSMSVGNFAQATQILSLIDSKYPFGPHSHQVQLDLIYSYYKGGKPDQAVATIDRFVRLNPNHADVDYAYFMRGVTNMELDDNLFQNLLGVDRDDRDPSKSKEAFEDFRRLIQKYPNSKYAPDARERMLHIKTRLAKYEIAVARFYMRRQAYVAAANRGRYVIENFPDTNQVQPALEVMVSSYDQLNLTELKENTMRTLRLNYPDSEFLN
jgi:outer membrane protein assembly factor BamD